MLGGALQQSMESMMGRRATLDIMAQGDAGGDKAPAAQRAVLEATQRMSISYVSRIQDTTLRVQTTAGARQVIVQGVDPAYGAIYRKRVAHGRWLADNDGARLTPSIVIDNLLWERLGRPVPEASTLTAYGADGAEVRLLIAGVLPPDPMLEGQPGVVSSAFMHADAPVIAAAGMAPRFVAWVPPESAGEVTATLTRMLSSTPVGAFSVNDSAMGYDDGFDTLRTGILVAALLMLTLGGMGLVNIALVTVRYRMREIGIRRSYGATGWRIFVGVLMESVVATTVAGVVGVAGAVALLRSPMVTDFFREQGLVDVPAFPVSAVLAGLGAAIAVGALAGILPALIATRMKVIDAIRA